MRSVTTDEVIASIDEAAAAEPGGVVAFDGDGTLWSGDVGEDFFVALVAAGGVREDARDALVREALAEHLAVDGTTGDIATRIHAAYLAGRFPEERACEIMTWIAAGWPRAELDRFCSRVVVEVGLAQRAHREALTVLAHARRRGLRVHLVSASPRAVVEQAAKLVGLDADDVIAASEFVANGLVTAAVERPIPYGSGKVTRLRARIGERPIHAAFGDNAFDVPMLLAARHPFAIRPKERLRARAEEVPGLAVVAPMA